MYVRIPYIHPYLVKYSRWKRVKVPHITNWSSYYRMCVYECVTFYVHKVERVCKPKKTSKVYKGNCWNTFFFWTLNYRLCFSCILHDGNMWINLLFFSSSSESFARLFRVFIYSKMFVYLNKILVSNFSKEFFLPQLLFFLSFFFFI